MDEKKRVSEVLRALKKKYPDASTALRHSNPLELLIATILSAQCTDKQVNIVTEKLFKKYMSASDYANADLEGFQQDIRSTGFYRNKAKNIIACCRMIEERFGSEVPDTMEELLQLPGVARKTANIVLGYGFGKAEGIAVDTHVARVAPRLGLTAEKKPDKIEKDLMKIVPREDWLAFNNLIVWHGRNTCTAKKPKCDVCVIRGLCPSAGMFG